MSRFRIFFFILSVSLGSLGGCDFRSPVDSKALKQTIQAELLAEIYRVVFATQKVDPTMFHEMLSRVDQGGSLEGVVNGLLHSEKYRELERIGPRASKAARKGFEKELVILQESLDAKTSFTEKDGLPPSRRDFVVPKKGQAKKNSSKSSLKNSSGKSGQELIAELRKIFTSSSIFTLKRVICVEAIKVYNERKSERGRLARWYGVWASRVASYPIHFGHEKRSRQDFDYHMNWAKQVSEDRVLWEVLTRLLQLLEAKQNS